MRSMRNDITRVAMVAIEPEVVQKEVFLSPLRREESNFRLYTDDTAVTWKFSTDVIPLRKPLRTLTETSFTCTPW